MYVLQALSLSRRPAVAFVIVGLFWGCFAAYVPGLRRALESMMPPLGYCCCAMH